VDACRLIWLVACAGFAGETVECMSVMHVRVATFEPHTLSQALPRTRVADALKTPLMYIF
jgi:hypothetical protein